MELEFQDLLLHQGIPSEEMIKKWCQEYSSAPWCIIFDDLSKEYHSNSIGGDLSTKFSHHFNVTVIVVKHSLYQSGSKKDASRLITLNTHNFIFTRSLRDLSTFSCFGRQCLGNKGGNTMLQAFIDATDKRDGSAGYLLVTLHPILSHRKMLLFTNIFSGEGDLIGYLT